MPSTATCAPTTRLAKPLRQFLRASLLAAAPGRHPQAQKKMMMMVMLKGSVWRQRRGGAQAIIPPLRFPGMIPFVNKMLIRNVEGPFWRQRRL